MYCTTNYKTKKAFVDAVRAFVKDGGPAVTLFSPGPFNHNPPTNGASTVEGPHYPEPHKWYSAVVVKDGNVIKAS